ncbi:LPXTG cell wall anchor domain-containing protein [Lactococcus garvieae]
MNIEDVNKSSKKVFPDTGVKNSLNLITIGVLMILSLIALIFFSERKQKRD